MRSTPWTIAWGLSSAALATLAGFCAASGAFAPFFVSTALAAYSAIQAVRS